ncbi:MCE family protein [Lapillicoccus jejuensis]|uniref:MCE family protein n=1 Tax=Lapillicoccus jejuensis TaxID=402171 RepID=UPI001477092C|nr:MCE family protein [Lapillicoccus jejuensis]
MTTQIALFVLVAVVGLSVIAVRYVQLPRVLGLSGYTVTLDLPDTGGAYTDADVSYRGVSVGRVGDIRLTADGAQADLHIDGSAPRIPSDLSVVVANRSAVGEQYVDLRPRVDPGVDGPWLAAGAHVRVSADQLPPSVESVLAASDRAIRSVPQDDLRTVVDELDAATRDNGENLQRLIDAGRAFTRGATENLQVTEQLIDSSGTVLATQERSAGDITTFSSNLAQISAQLQSSDGDLRALIGTAPGAAAQVQGLVDDVGAPLGVLMGNLVTTAQVFSANSAGLQGVYVRLPAAVSAAHAVVGQDGLKVGLVTSFFQPLPCTNGYGGTTARPPTDTSAGPGVNAGAACVPTSPDSDVRGSQAALAAADRTRLPIGTVSGATTLADLLGGG